MTTQPPSRDNVTNKFPGLAADKPVKSISVERPVDRDEKTVTETNLAPIDATSEKPGRTKRPKISQTKSASRTEPIVNPGTTRTPRHLSKTKTTVPSVAKEPKLHAGMPSEDDHNILELPPSPEQRKAKRRKIGWWSAATAAAIFAGGGALLYFSPILAIEEISFEGLDLVAASEAEQRAAVFLETPLPQVTDRKATEVFQDNPAVDNVTVRAEPPHGMVLTVNEHRPIAMSPRGKQYVVFSNSGTELAEIPAKRAQAFDLPVVASASDVADQEVFATITEVLGSLPDELRDQVRAASGTSIDSIELEMSSGKMVMWGNSEQAEKKTRVLEALLGLPEDQAAEISEYDVSAPDFPVTR